MRDFEPLRGRRVIVWPDHDAPGQAHAQRVADRVTALGGTAEWIDVAALGLPEGGDVVDYLSTHPDATAADLEALPRFPYEKEKSNAVVLVRADAVKIEPIRWLWEDWLATGKLHILAGAPGTGKTTISLALAATISSGGRWPDGQGRRGSVLVWSGEDDPSDVIALRLVAAGADLERIHFIRGIRGTEDTVPFDPSTDMRRLQEAAATILTFAC